ncbi:UDP-N-acetylmuramoyl-L-alanyl-D-glutamate--2,6-diaminopimelate ligase [Halobacillus andaensis]|uniref:UDP-N-acetylmuramoyl-L-alanyl-D-glutamate--2,6-diaminopimelate ligase n=1 Tax=Halobacillus andaensis TaxID=1176239 RepID=A0A917ETL4_HALAA|nr:UDP-N-acetylmuramoyl-L-alanyl-D-glutamate--2,6-diaminopimelate ligase [Halobacillus andaensis]MBP2003588.1 UDP-N-acetylmuramoyl-L-alanyl-D-glutamate--2,6-diaminopimelate ligase [Halobacillus andaensis]GGF11768.1 UDP-N-acetylmuramoyl-L-alanyl-D-glutamate--2,6-diaminopimelate ligase [Halobacillus andaensis]
MNITKLLESIPYYKTNQSIDELEINGVSMDSRSIDLGDVFVCIIGSESDGHDFVHAAIDQGAALIIAQRELDVDFPVVTVNDTTKALAMIASTFYNYPTEQVHTIGVTGTNGKTTITYLLDEIFTLNNHTTATIGTIQMNIAGQTYPVKNTTPDALSLQQSFNQMLNHGVDTAIMEVSSHALDQGRVYGCDFNVAIFTNLTQDHLDYHESMDDYLRAKSLLFAQLGNGYNMEREKFAIINQDSPFAHKLIRSTAQPTLTYGIHSEADITAKQISLHEKGSSFVLSTPNGEVSIESPLMGMFSVYNMLASAGAAIVSGVDLAVIQQSFKQTKGVRGRFEPVLEGQSFGVVVDYAHTPDSLENVLNTMQEFCKSKIRVVVGCGGDRDRTKRPLMADVAMKYADQAIFTSDNPRTEDPEVILNDMTSHLDGDFIVEENRRKAIDIAITNSEQGDMVLIAGKGHETYQEINGVRHDFDDREVARDILLKVKGSQM